MEIQWQITLTKFNFLKRCEFETSNFREMNITRKFEACISCTKMRPVVFQISQNFCVAFRNKNKTRHAKFKNITGHFLKRLRVPSRRKPSNASRVFTDLLSNSPKSSPRFSPGYEGTENMFYFLISTKLRVSV